MFLLPTWWGLQHSVHFTLTAFCLVGHCHWCVNHQCSKLSEAGIISLVDPYFFRHPPLKGCSAAAWVFRKDTTYMYFWLNILWSLIKEALTIIVYKCQRYYSSSPFCPHISHQVALSSLCYLKGFEPGESSIFELWVQVSKEGWCLEGGAATGIWGVVEFTIFGEKSYYLLTSQKFPIKMEKKKWKKSMIVFTVGLSWAPEMKFLSNWISRHGVCDI